MPEPDSRRRELRGRPSDERGDARPVRRPASDDGRVPPAATGRRPERDDRPRRGEEPPVRRVSARDDRRPARGDQRPARSRRDRGRDEDDAPPARRAPAREERLPARAAHRPARDDGRSVREDRRPARDDRRPVREDRPPAREERRAARDRDWDEDDDRPVRGAARRPSGRSAPSRDGGRRKQLILIGGLAAAVIVVLVATIVLLFGGNDPGPRTAAGAGESGAGSTGGGGSGAGARVIPEDERAAFESRFKTARREKDAAALFNLWKEAKTRTEDLAFAGPFLEAAYELKPKDPKVRADLVAFLHYEHYRIPKELEEDLQHLDEVNRRLREYDDRLFRTDEAELAKVRKIERELLDRLRAEQAAIAANPTRKYAEQIKRTLELDKNLNDREFEYAFTPHYVIAVEKGSNVSYESIVLNRKAMFEQLYEQFEKTYVKRWNLRQRRDYPFLAIVLKDRESFDRFNLATGLSLPPGVLAYYHHQTEYIVLYEGETAINALEADGTVFHEGTHQLFDGYRSEHRADTHLWFQEGLAEYWGSVAIVGERQWRLFEFNQDRAEEYWVNKHIQHFSEAAMGNRFPLESVEISLRDLLDLKTRQNLGDIAKKAARNVDLTQYPPQARERVERYLVQRLSSGLYATAWSFFYFCYNFENGKYSSAMDNYIKEEFEGRSGYFVWKKCFNVATPEDTERLEREWQTYVNDVLLARAVPDPDAFLRAKRAEIIKRQREEEELERMREQALKDRERAQGGQGGQGGPGGR